MKHDLYFLVVGSFRKRSQVFKSRENFKSFLFLLWFFIPWIPSPPMPHLESEYMRMYCDFWAILVIGALPLSCRWYSATVLRLYSQIIQQNLTDRSIKMFDAPSFQEQSSLLYALWDSDFLHQFFFQYIGYNSYIIITLFQYGTGVTCDDGTTSWAMRRGGGGGEGGWPRKIH